MALLLPLTSYLFPPLISTSCIHCSTLQRCVVTCTLSPCITSSSSSSLPCMLPRPLLLFTVSFRVSVFLVSWTGWPAVLSSLYPWNIFVCAAKRKFVYLMRGTFVWSIFVGTRQMNPFIPSSIMNEHEPLSISRDEQIQPLKCYRLQFDS